MCVGKFSDTKIKILSDERCSCTFNCLSSYQPLGFCPTLSLILYLPLSCLSHLKSLFLKHNIGSALLIVKYRYAWNYVYENCDGVTLMCHHNKTGWGENGLVDSSLAIFEYKRWVDIKEKMGPPSPLPPPWTHLPTYMYIVVYSNAYLGLSDSIGNVTGFPVWNFTTQLQNVGISLLPVTLAVLWILVFLFTAFGARVSGWVSPRALFWSS